MSYIQLVVDTSDDSMFGQSGAPNCDYNIQEWVDTLAAEIATAFGATVVIETSEYETRLIDTDLNDDPWNYIQQIINTTWQNWLDRFDDDYQSGPEDFE